MPDNDFEQSYAMSHRVAAVRAATLVLLYGLPQEDRLDLEQEALLALWRKVLLFDARRASWRTFSEKVVASRMASLVRSLHSARSGYGREEPFDGPALMLPAPTDCVDLRVDVRHVLAGVSQFDQAVALSLMDHAPIETAWRLGVCRATVYRAIGRLRAAFTEAGLSPRSKQ